MILLIATAALLSCQEAKDLVRKIPTHQFSFTEYTQVVDVIKEQAPRGCRLHRRQYWINSPFRHRFHYQGYRPGWIKPTVDVDIFGDPVLVFRF